MGLKRQVQPAVSSDGQARQTTDERALLDIVIGQTKYSKEDRDLIRRTLCKDANQDEFEMFMKYAERTGLDPFARQLCLIKRRGRCAIQVQIDGYRLIADRTQLYAGNDEPVFEGQGELPNGKAHPLQATATVWKIIGGNRQPFTATVRWEEYYPGDGDDGFMYRKMPYGQLAKCAEALAFRKAFPADLSGLYTGPAGARADG